MLTRLILLWVGLNLAVVCALLVFQSTLALVVGGVVMLLLTFVLVCLLFARLPSPREIERRRSSSPS